VTNPTHVSPASSDPSAQAEGSRAPDEHLLFVGGNRQWFHDVEHRLLELRPSWTVAHTLDLVRAESILDSQHCDGLILHPSIGLTDESRAVLEQRFPRVFKIILGEEMTRGSTPSTAGLATSASSDDAVDSAETVVRAILVEEWTSHPSTKSLLGQIKKLPTLPRLHVQIAHELQSSNGSLELVSHLVRQDPVMAAKFLQVINSAESGLSYAVNDPGEAVMFLGAVRTRALVLMAGVFSQFDEVRCPGFSAEDTWHHSLQVAQLAQGVTLVQTEDPKLAEMAFTAGLLHDIGKLVLASNVPDMYSTAHKLQQYKRIQESEAELAILSSSHAELGASLLGAWRLPLAIIEAVGWHHTPSQSRDLSFSVLTAVHVANVLAHESDTPTCGVGRPPRFDMMYLVKLGLLSRRNYWREACGLPVRHDEGTTVEDTAQRRSEAKYN
jgi:putative nucleotidyltransferase with HDIG domain